MIFDVDVMAIGWQRVWLGANKYNSCCESSSMAWTSIYIHSSRYLVCFTLLRSRRHNVVIGVPGSLTASEK